MALCASRTALLPHRVHVWGPFCGRHCTPTTSRPGFGPFLWTARHTNHLSYRFGACFVDGKFLGAGLTMAVVDNCLCIRELLNILAANGEQGEYGNDWWAESCAPGVRFSMEEVVASVVLVLSTKKQLRFRSCWIKTYCLSYLYKISILWILLHGPAAVYELFILTEQPEGVKVEFPERL